MTTQTWTLTIEQDAQTGDAVVTFPPDALEVAGWREGDTIVWDIRADGKSYTLTKKTANDGNES
jgi:hypothetical protein